MANTDIQKFDWNDFREHDNNLLRSQHSRFHASFNSTTWKKTKTGLQ